MLNDYLKTPAKRDHAPTAKMSVSIEPTQDERLQDALCALTLNVEMTDKLREEQNDILQELKQLAQTLGGV